MIENGDENFDDLSEDGSGSYMDEVDEEYVGKLVNQNKSTIQGIDMNNN